MTPRLEDNRSVRLREPADVKRVNLAEKFDLIRVHWWPKIAGKLNGQYEADAHGLWLQPISSLKTGNVTNDRTRQQLDRI